MDLSDRVPSAPLHDIQQILLHKPYFCHIL